VYVGANYENEKARVMFLSNREKLYFHFYVSKYAKRASIGIIDDARDILTAYLHLANSQVDVKRRDAIAIPLCGNARRSYFRVTFPQIATNVRVQSHDVVSLKELNPSSRSETIASRLRVNTVRREGNR